MLNKAKPPKRNGGKANKFAKTIYNLNKYNSWKPAIQSKLVRVTRKNPCKICGKSDWCSYSENEEMFLCMRESAGSIKTASNGAFIHILKDGSNSPARKKSTETAKSAKPNSKSGNGGKSKVDTPLADPDHRHEVYTYLLEECLTLSQKHAEHLMNDRGFFDTTIVKNLYASVPSIDVREAASKMMHEKFGDKLRGVAGFYKEEWSKEWKMADFCSEGFFVPYRDEKGRISGLQFRRDNHKPKYIWFSTNPDKYNEGTSSGSPVHFIDIDYAREYGEIVITEGALKADCLNEFTNMPCVAFAGLTSGNFDELMLKLKNILTEPRKANIAYDSDWALKLNVRSAILKLSDTLEENGIEVSIWVWDGRFGKGIDDLLLNELKEAQDVE